VLRHLLRKQATHLLSYRSASLSHLLHPSMIRRVLKARKFVPKLRGVARFSTYLLAFFFFFLSKWIERNFGAPNLEQILYHIQFGTERLLDADQALIYSFITRCVLLPIGFSTFAVMTERFVGYVRLYCQQRFKTDTVFVKLAI
jgi:hypothetical protein